MKKKTHYILQKLVIYVRIIWDYNPGKYHPVYNEDLVKSIQFRMLNHSYRFRPMIRIILPKPKKRTW